MANLKQEETEIDQDIIARVIQNRRTNEDYFQKILQLQKCIRKATSVYEVESLKTAIELLKKEREATTKVLKENAVIVDLVNQAQIDSLKKCLVKLYAVVDVTGKAICEMLDLIMSSPKEGSDNLNLDNLDLDTEEVEDSGTKCQESGDNEATVEGKKMPFSFKVVETKAGA